MILRTPVTNPVAVTDTATDMLVAIVLVLVANLDIATDKLKLGVGNLFQAMLLATLTATLKLAAMVIG